MSAPSSCTFCRAAIAAQEGRVHEAIALFETILQAQPQHHPARLYRARLYALTGRPLDAIEELNLLTGVAEYAREAHRGLSGVFFLLGMYEDAMHHLTSSEHRSPLPGYACNPGSRSICGLHATEG